MASAGSAGAGAGDAGAGAGAGVGGGSAGGGSQQPAAAAAEWALGAQELLIRRIARGEGLNSHEMVKRYLRGAEDDADIDTQLLASVGKIPTAINQLATEVCKRHPPTPTPTPTHTRTRTHALTLQLLTPLVPSFPSPNVVVVVVFGACTRLVPCATKTRGLPRRWCHCCHWCRELKRCSAHWQSWSR